MSRKIHYTGKLRIKRFLQNNNLDIGSFAQKLGVCTSTASRLQGTSEKSMNYGFSPKMIGKVAELIGSTEAQLCDTEWDNTAYLNTPGVPVPSLPRVMEALTDEEKKAVNLLLGMNIDTNKILELFNMHRCPHCDGLGYLKESLK